MAKIIDIKKDREPKIGDEVDLFNVKEDETFSITRKGDFRCWIRLELTDHEKLELVREILHC